MDTPRVVDLLRIITLVQSRRGLGPAELARLCGKTQRSIYRDIKCLREAGVPLDFDRTSRGYRIAHGYHLPPVHVTPEEALAIWALCEHLAEQEQVPFLRPACEAAQKLLSTMPESIVSDVASRARHIAIRTGPSLAGEQYDDVYDRMNRAIETRRALECVYDAASESRPSVLGRRPRRATDRPFELEPYTLLFAHRAWYVIGRRSDRGNHDNVRCLRLGRFTKVTPTKRSYEIPTSFSLDAYLGNAWRMIPGDRDHRVTVRFDAEVAATVAETRWHRTQEIEERDDGSCIFRCTVSGFDEIVWWILGYGPHCTVLRPIALRDRVRELVTQTAALYDDRPPRVARQRA